MSTFVVKSSDSTGFSYDQGLYNDVGGASYLYDSFSSTKVKGYDDASNYLLLTGYGFTQSGSGTINKIDYVVDGIEVLRASGLSLSVQELSKLQNDPEKFAALVFKSDDNIYLTPYADQMRSGTGVDSVYGGKGNDFLAGGSGHDKLLGEAGDDKLFGQGGDDRLIGGSGHDKLSGGAGEDKFIYSSASQGGDAVSDFSSSDILMFEGSAFGLGSFSGTLKSSNFATRSNSHLAFDSTDRFIFDRADHTLWFDSDGKGGKEALLMVYLGNSYIITHSDIMVI
jgi:Ca2+-binding RTX toxin-like protein